MTVQDRTQEQLLAALAQLGGMLTSEDDIAFEGTRFVIPQTMTITESVDFLIQKMREEDQYTTFTRTFDYRPYDGARAATMAMRRAFGMARQVPTRTMFGNEPPQLLTINVGVNETEQIPWGNIVVPMLPEAIITFGIDVDDEKGPLFNMEVTGPRKYRFHVEGLFAMVAEELKTNSLYRGKAFDGSGQFLDLSGIDPSRVVYSDDVMTQLDANIWSMLRHTQAMRTHGIGLKRAVLLEGPYGTGKTLAAFLTAKEAVTNEWTFVYCRPGRDDLREVMTTASLYQPSVVFFEDIDVMSDANGHDADQVSKLLDAFDGITNKGTEVLAVMTTNHADKIHKGMTRPGRLDAIIHIGALDMRGVTVLIESAIPPALLGNVDYDAVYDAMKGYLPAFVKEAVDRSLRYAIARGHGQAEVIETADLVNAANGLRAQFDLMNRAEEHKPGDSLTVALTRVVKEATEGHAKEVMDTVGDEADRLENNTDTQASNVVYGVRNALDSTAVYDHHDNRGYLSVED